MTVAPDPTPRASAALAALATERAAAWRGLAERPGADRDGVARRLTSPREQRAAEALVDPSRTPSTVATAALVADLAEREAAAWIDDAAAARRLRRQQQPHIDALVSRPRVDS